MEAPSPHPADRRMMRAPVKPAPPIGLGIPLPEVMLMCSPTMTIPIRQRDTRTAAWPRVTFVVRREPTVELSPSRDQLYCSLSGLSRYCWRSQIEVEQRTASEMSRPLRSAADAGADVRRANSPTVSITTQRPRAGGRPSDKTCTRPSTQRLSELVLAEYAVHRLRS
jgi:hypothetical protein